MLRKFRRYILLRPFPRPVMQLPLRTLATALILVFAAMNAGAQMQSGKEHVTFEKLGQITGSVGQTITVVVKAVIEEGWHTYGLTPTVGPDGLGPEPMTITAGPDTVLVAGKGITIVKGASKHRDEVWGADVEEVAGKVEIKVPLFLPAGLQQGVHNAVITVGFQMCDGQMCLAPEYIDLPIEILIKNVRR